VEPTPETQGLINELERDGDSATAVGLERMAAVTRAIVPNLVGLSLSLVENNLTFTLVASNELIAAQDAIQYLDGGPCVDAVDREKVFHVRVADPLDEGVWQFYAQATAAAGIASTLSLPILDDGRPIGGVNLYASTPDAFEGQVEALARALGSSAENAIKNADLQFSTRLDAAAADSRLAEFDDVNHAIGVVMAAHGVDSETARSQIREAALRAGISEHGAARAVAQFLLSDR